MRTYSEEITKIREEFPIFSEDMDHDKYAVESKEYRAIQDACIQIGPERWFEIAEAMRREQNPGAALAYGLMNMHPGGMMGYVIGMTIDQLCIIGQEFDIYVRVCRNLAFNKDTVAPVMVVREAIRCWLTLKRLIDNYTDENWDMPAVNWIDRLNDFIEDEGITPVDVLYLEPGKLMEFLNNNSPPMYVEQEEGYWDDEETNPN